MTDCEGLKELTGLIIKRFSGYYYVADESDCLVECKLRGKVKDKAILAGDRVRVSLTEPGKGIIEEVLPRHMEMVRPAIANVDQVLVVMSYDRPAPNSQLLDRLLLMAEYHGLAPTIVFNKCDLLASPIINNMIDLYRNIGYQVVLASTKKNIGKDELVAYLTAHITVIAGPSGVGKSSLLNLMIPGSELKTQEVSEKIGRGRHTTRHAELFRLPGGGWIADTPGFSLLETPDVKKVDLDSYFLEFGDPSEECRFSDCIHSGEKDCGVKQAVETGEIASSRYESYLCFLEEVIQKERCYK